MLGTFSGSGEATSTLVASEGWDGGRLLKMRDVVALTNCHPNTIRRATESGVLPCYRLPGNARRFKLSEVRRWLGENTDSVIDDSGLKQGKSFRVACAAIIRVSSAKQNTARGESDKSSLEHQEERVAKFIKEKWGNKADVTWYKSVGGGMDFNRPALIRLINDIIAGKFRGGFLVAQDFTRICRFGVKLIEHLAAIGGCKLVYTMDEQEAEDKGYSDTLQSELLSVLTHFTAKESGRKAKVILTVRVSPEVVQEICAMGKAGYSFRYIANELQRQGKGRGECGREITKRVVERILKEHGEPLRLLESNTEFFPASVTQNSFCEFFTACVRLTGLDENRVRQTLLIQKYRDWCSQHGKTPMTSNSIRKTLKVQFSHLSTKFTDNACLQYVGLSFNQA